MRVDATASRIELSVADLIEAGSHGSLAVGFANRGGYERMWIGQAIHARYQQQQMEADPGYRSEVSVSATAVVRGWELTVRGRADGLRHDEDGTLWVQEIKSVRRDRPPSEATLSMYRRQAAIYAWMLAADESQEADRVDAELVLIETASHTADVEPLDLDLDEVDVWVRKRLQSIVSRAQHAQARRADRAESGRRLEFPHSAMRPGQQAVIDAAARTIEQREHLLIEAPTGLGKTVAALYPAVKAALEEDLRVYVLTAKNLQQEMALRVADLLNPDGALGGLQLRAKARMCANDEIVCHEDYCRFARDYFGKLHASGLVDNLDDGSVVRPERIFDAASQLEVCPFEVSLELAHRSPVVIGDYNYAFDPYVALREFGPEGNLDDAILIVDEIHNLLERARGYWSPELSSVALRDAASFVGSRGAAGSAIAHLVKAIAVEIENWVDAAFENQPGPVEEVEGELPVETLQEIRPDFEDAFLDHLEAARASRALTADDLLREQYYAFQRFLDTLAEFDSRTFSAVLSRQGDDRRFRILCLDPSRFLGRILGRTRAVIGLSATLSPPEFYRHMLGLSQDRFAVEQVESPFPPENRRVVIDAEVSTLWRDRPANYSLIGERLGTFASAVPGNVMALFPSYQFLAEVAGRIEVQGHRLVVQERTNTPADREALLSVLEDGEDSVLLLAVAGGVFAEGVDYPGDMLKAVAVVGPALPPVTLERELLKRYFEEQFERGFEYAFVLPGMTRVVQAAGRLIRSETDTGVIALLGHRFRRPPYSGYLPEDWFEGEPEVGSAAEVAAEFFADRADIATDRQNRHVEAIGGQLTD